MGQAQLTLGDASLITVTFLFTDIEGSTSLWERESEAMRTALQRHKALLFAAIEAHRGYVFKTVGDPFCFTFDDAADALGGACQIQTSLRAEKWPTRAPLRVRAYGKDSTQEKGKFINIWKKVDGDWKIHSNIGNTNAPAK